MPPSHSKFDFKLHLLYLMASFSHSMGDPEQNSSHIFSAHRRIKAQPSGHPCQACCGIYNLISRQAEGPCIRLCSASSPLEHLWGSSDGPTSPLSKGAEWRVSVHHSYHHQPGQLCSKPDGNAAVAQKYIGKEKNPVSGHLDCGSNKVAQLCT